MFNFSKIPLHLDKQAVLNRVGGDANIFHRYFGKFELGKVYKSPFRRDNNPSTGFYVGRTGKLYFNDLSTGEKLDCFGFVSKLFNVSYSDAIEMVAKDFNTLSEKNNVREKVIIEPKPPTLIQFIPGRWNKEALSFWKNYGIEEKDINKEELFVIKKLWVNKKQISGDDLKFAIIIKDGESVYTKIYSPYSTNMKWLNNIPIHIPFGLNGLKGEDDTVYITKSYKDMLVMKKLFTDVIATQNESSSAFPSTIREYLKGRYRRRVIVWDADDVGIANCEVFKDDGFECFHTPREYYELFKIKDPSDFSSYYGLKELKKLFIR